jgi:hypothetical protein
MFHNATFIKITTKIISARMSIILHAIRNGPDTSSLQMVLHFRILNYEQHCQILKSLVYYYES